MQLFPQNLINSRLLLSFSIFVFISLGSFAVADESDSSDVVEQQQKLQQLLGKIGEAQEKRAEQRAILEILNKKMECNWSLIQDYGACDKKYEENKLEHLNCATKAKEKARDCLDKISTN